MVAVTNRAFRSLGLRRRSAAGGRPLLGAPHAADGCRGPERSLGPRRRLSIARSTALASRALALGVAASRLGCGSAGGGAVEPLPPATAGLGSESSRMTVPLGGGRAKVCQATLVAERWALTAAHCFADAPVGGVGTFDDWRRAFPLDEVRFHPLAHESGDTMRRQRWPRSGFQAAHDLALVPVPGGAPTPQAAPVAGPDRELSMSGEACFARCVPGLGPETAWARLLGEVPAESLLGDDVAGTLLAAESDGVRPGDSGSGVLLPMQEARCGPGSSPRGHLLVGVIQNAHPTDLSLPFGSVPVYSPAHHAWIVETIAEPDR